MATETVYKVVVENESGHIMYTIEPTCLALTNIVRTIVKKDIELFVLTNADKTTQRCYKLKPNVLAIAKYKIYNENLKKQITLIVDYSAIG